MGGPESSLRFDEVSNTPWVPYKSQSGVSLSFQ